MTSVASTLEIHSPTFPPIPFVHLIPATAMASLMARVLSFNSLLLGCVPRLFRSQHCLIEENFEG